MADEHRSRLGRGLASLIGDVGGEATQAERPRAQRKVPIEFIKANPRNPRRTFTDAELGELSDSIKQHGVIQPIVVRPVKGSADRYEIIAGERRWRAAQRAGLHEVPIVPVDVSDALALEIAIVENVQREDLNPLEEAQGYQALAAEFKRSQEEIAKIVGKSRSHVANMMRLIKLPDDVKALIASGELTAGHARALIGLPDPSAIAKRIVAEGLNVRQTEALAHEEGVPERKPQKPRAAASVKSAKDADTLALEKRLSDALGMKVTIDDHDGAGAVQIRYADLDQLDDIIRRLEAGG
ncbi:chromosome segregation DNA-binding protein [Rhodopseudomonas thermotolerans]|uniref:Chromosome segregation DNA-binding protein n=2 Tax=Rhodopseudomonas TaxID=1073 RepID=A0A336JUC0_9BRAD|nr:MULTISPECIES: ParB/RepB/Spo0J family partition protein [Rhodopseudomonas]RED25853.1 chromosome segregation DNA-binding protein [Rhodopseudomonas pentothenatexigens]REF90987.1 chromosome segregation DNA-binding protein [Rhodopseudomonas thermotolerans]SSW93072.1 chromosome segregation DNA-binding protein [Rhodopseudomonas pentothenatexigens]